MHYLKQVFLLYLAWALDRTPNSLGRTNQQIWRDAQLRMALDLFASMLVPLGAGLSLVVDMEPDLLAESSARTTVALVVCGVALIGAFLLALASSGQCREVPGLLVEWRASGKGRARLSATRVILWSPLALCTAILFAWQALSKFS